MANLDDLKRAWKSQSGISQERFDQIGTRVRSSTELLQTTIFRRDMVETFASIVVVAAFSFFLLRATNWVDWSGCLIVVIAGITIPIVLWWSRRRALTVVSAANFRDFINVEIDYLRRQVQLLRMIGWWYLLPLYIGICLIMIGIVGPRYTVGEIVILGFCLAICAVLYVYLWWLNQSACQRRLEPLLQYYVDMREALDHGDDFAPQLTDPTDFLRPEPRKPMTKRRRWICIIVTVIVTAFVAAAGYGTMQHFDARTGVFIFYTVPVVGVLMIVVSGLYREIPFFWPRKVAGK